MHAGYQHLLMNKQNRCTAVPASMSLGSQGYGMLAVSVCSTLLCFAGLLFDGTRSLVQGLIAIGWLSLLPRQHASTACRACTWLAA